MLVIKNNRVSRPKRLVELLKLSSGDEINKFYDNRYKNSGKVKHKHKHKKSNPKRPSHPKQPSHPRHPSNPKRPSG